AEFGLRGGVGHGVVRRDELLGAILEGEGTCSLIGSRRSSRCRPVSTTSSRARAREMRPKGHSPMSRVRPSRLKRKIQLFVPAEVTRRYSPPPTGWSPLAFAFVTAAAADTTKMAIGEKIYIYTSIGCKDAGRHRST